jgi:hypothetical protein
MLVVWELGVELQLRRGISKCETHIVARRQIGGRAPLKNCGR